MKTKFAKKFLPLILTLSLLVSISACSGAPATAPPAATPATTPAPATTTVDEFNGPGLNEAKVIKVGIQPGQAQWELNSIKHLIEDEFAADGIKIEYSSYTYGPPIIEAISAGELDFAVTGDLPVFTGISNNIGVIGVYRGGVDPQGSATIVLPSSPIQTVADLVGKKVGLSVGSGAHNFAGQLLKSGGYSIDDIEVVNLVTGDLAAALTSGDIDAAITWEPQVAIIAKQTGGKVILSSEGVYNSLSLVDARVGFVEKNPKLTARFLKAFHKLDDYVANNTDEVVDLIYNATGIEKDVWGNLYRTTYNGYFTDKTWQEAENTKQFLLDNDLILSDFDVHKIYTDKYLKEADRLLKAEN
jgi:sulfonate transport system substrate-binding protein